MSFQRSIGLTALLFTAVGGIIGSGWLFGPMYVAQIAGPAAVLAWVIGGVLMTFINFTLAELAASHPMAGGMVRFAQLSHGPLMSFTVGWLVWLSSVAVAPVETLALLQYANNYLPNLVHTVGGVSLLTGKGLSIAAALLLFMTALNFYSVKIFSRMSTGIVVIKLIVPLLVVITLLHTHFQSANFSQFHGFMPYGWHGVLAALPIGGVIFSFIGNSPAIQLAAETRNPKLALPIAIIGSVLLCTLLYVLLQVAFVGAIEPHYLHGSWADLKFTGQTGPFAGIAAALGLSWLVLLIYADAIISPFGTAFIYTAATGRVNYALSRTKFFPEFFSKLTHHGVPAYALIFNYIIGLLLFLPFPTWQQMVGFIVSCFVISYSIGPLALMPLRQQTMDAPPSFRLPWGHLFAFLAFYICNLMVYWTGWDIIWRLLIAISIGFVVFGYQYIRDKTAWPANLWQTAKWLIPYLAGLGIISYIGAFGGRHFVKFGPDMLILLVFSAIIYALAMRYVVVEQKTKSAA